MNFRFFGQFLLARKAITEAHLLSALTLQARRASNVGEVCMQLGFLDSKTVAVILEKQRKLNLRFGEIALHEGYLTPEQLEQALASQRSNQIRLGEALLQVKALSPERLESELAVYQQQEARLIEEEETQIAQAPHSLVVQTIVNMTIEGFGRFARLALKASPPYRAGSIPQQDVTGHMFKCIGETPFNMFAATSQKIALQAFTQFLREPKDQTPAYQARLGLLELFAHLALHMSYELSKDGDRWTLEPAREPYTARVAAREWLVVPLSGMEDELLLIFDI